MKVTIVGYYGTPEDQPCGQMVKVRTLYAALKEYAPHIKADVVDTKYIEENRVVLIWKLLKALLTSQKIIFLAAERGRIFMLPFFYFVQKLLRIEVYHDSIGGAVIDEMEDHPKWKKYLNTFKGNWMESPQEVLRLQAKGVVNAQYIPNFKILSALSIEDVERYNHEQPFRFCTFCRVEPLKGIEDALKAIRYVNEKSPGSATLDVYGPIQQGEEGWFKQLQEDYKQELHYCGMVDPEESVQVIAPYMAMLFPTRYLTEGMPGSIVDAMFAGVPVVARRWKWCDNMITDGYNGLVYDFDNPEAINDVLLNVCKTPRVIIEMKGNCLAESVKYSAELNIKRIVKEMNLC